MKKENKNIQKPRKFTASMQKKLVVLFVLVLLAIIGLCVRLILINKESGDQYLKQVLQQQEYDSYVLPYKRGDIVDANGTKLAYSEKVYNLIIDSRVMHSDEKYLVPTMAALNECFELSTSDIEAYMDQNMDSQYYKVLEQLSYEEIADFITLQEDPEAGVNIKGVWFEEEYKRSYPYSTLACDLIGFTSKDNVGMYGLEEYYNTVLNGTNGREYGYLNTDSYLERTTKAAIDGNTIVSTIDVTVQSIVEKYILAFNEEHKDEYREGEAGSTNTGVIIMDPNTGEIIAMASYPYFDLNNPKDLTLNYTAEEIAAMEAADTDYTALNEIWKNFCISHTYEPGSVTKAFTIASGLETGKLTGNETFNCTGYLTVGDYDIHCVNTLGHGLLTVSEALEKSCNVALMDMGLTIGKDIFMTYNKNFNFGLKTNIDLAGEARTDSLVFNVDTMVPTDLAIASFGQGYNVTMIQTAAAFSSIINGGYYYEPHVVDKILSTDGAVVENIEPRLLKQTVSAVTSEKMLGYLNNVVALGTGAKARPAGYTMGGKTGTAETYPRNTEHYVVSFMGYVPADDPQVLIYVVVDEPNTEDQAHSTYAMGLVRSIMTEVLPYMNIFMTEELTEEEKVELSALGLYETQPLEGESVEGTEASGTNTTGTETTGEATEEGTVTENAEAEEGTTAEESTADFMEIDPETGYYIDPTTGQMIDPETGFVVDPTQSGLGGL